MQQRNKGRIKCGPGHRKQRAVSRRNTVVDGGNHGRPCRKYNSQGHLGCLDFPHHRGGGLSHSAKVSKERGPEKAGGHGVTRVTDSWFI